MSIQYVYRTSERNFRSIRFFSSEQVVGSSYSYGKPPFVHEGVIVQHLKIVESVVSESGVMVYRPLWRFDWFSDFIPDDHAPAVQRLSELGLTEYAMDLIRQAKDADFIAPELAPVFRL